jgi:hypothetical protein
VRFIELVSPLSHEESEARLRAATDRDGLLSCFGSRPVVGKVSGGSVRLRKRIGYTNSFQTFLVGSLEVRDDVTMFRGRAGMHPLVIGIMAVYFGLLTFIGAPAFVAAEGGQGLPLGAITPLLMLVFGVGLVWFGRWLARDEEAYLVAFVTRAIAAGRAQEAEPGVAPDPADTPSESCEGSAWD